MSAIYQKVTDQIVRALEQGVGKWERPWNFTASDAFSPLNVASRKPYRGINPLVLWGECQAKGYASAEWGTFRQWKEKGASVKKGERATSVVFWKFANGGGEEAEDEGQGSRRLCFVNYYNVFNAEQVEGYEGPEETSLISEEERIGSADEFFKRIGAKLKHGGNRAFYMRTSDDITLPRFKMFKTADDYYSTCAHEHVHWTGPQHRLDREMGKRFGDAAYAMEELVAELGAAFVMAELRLSSTPRADHAQYIQSWISVLKKDSRAIFTAASKAQQAVDFLMVKAGRRTEEVAA